MTKKECDNCGGSGFIEVLCAPKPCIICGLGLVPAFSDQGWRHMQPDGGGEVKLIFAWGSRYDCNSYSGVICDDCGEKLFEKMERVNSP